MNIQNLPRAIILRGLPGSGKTTIGNILQMTGEYCLFEADMYFYKYDSKSRRLVYHFDASKLKDVHEWCLHKTIDVLKSGHRVVVSNTFTRMWELEPYLKAFAELGVTPTVLHAESVFQSIHGVPQEKIAAMAARWEPFKVEK